MPNIEPRYTGRSQTLTTNTTRAAELVGIAAEDMRMANGGTARLPLDDIQRVREVAASYFAECADRGVMPTVRGVAARFGVHRNALYEAAKRHPDSDFSRWLEDFSDSCGEIMMQAAVEGVVAPVPAIFVAKSRHGWRDAPIQIEVNPQTPLGAEQTAEVIAERYSNLPDY